jgi:NADH-quinone oxidoreductase subunit F
MKQHIQGIIQQTGTGKEAVIPILQAIQKVYNYLPEDALKMVCESTDITAAEIVGVASFYSQFRFQPAGKHLVKVCVGTACHVKGAGLVYDSIKRDLNIASDQDTDADRNFTVEKVSCLGCCTLAPVVQIDDTTYGHVTPATSRNIIEDFKSRKVGDGKEKKAGKNIVTLQGEIRIGLGSCCVASGSDDIRQAVEEAVYEDELNVNIKHVGCVGMCHQVPLVEVLPEGKHSHLYAKVKPNDIKPIIDRHFQAPGFFNRLRNRFDNLIESIQSDDRWEGVERYSINVREKHVLAFLGNQIPIATEHRGVINPVDLEEYQKRGGFKGLERALGMNPTDVIEEVKASGIKGSGGAGFPDRHEMGAGSPQQTLTSNT